jgi:hypothetical protein
MISKTFVIQTLVRLVRDGELHGSLGRRYFRPLVVGPAILRRAAGSGGPWTVDLDRDRWLRPRAPRPAALPWVVERLRSRGLECRVAAALACPQDATGASPASASPPPPELRLPTCSEFYGWAVLYQPRGMRGRALVDADDRFDDLPACFELPLELLDRTAYLEARGIPSRPIAVVTQPEDFVVAADGRLRNRFFPEAEFRLRRGPNFLAG